MNSDKNDDHLNKVRLRNTITENQVERAISESKPYMKTCVLCPQLHVCLLYFPFLICALYFRIDRYARYAFPISLLCTTVSFIAVTKNPNTKN